MYSTLVCASNIQPTCHNRYINNINRSNVNARHTDKQREGPRGEICTWQGNWIVIYFISVSRQFHETQGNKWARLCRKLNASCRTVHKVRLYICIHTSCVDRQLLGRPGRVSDISMCACLRLCRLFLLAGSETKNYKYVNVSIQSLILFCFVLFCSVFFLLLLLFF